VLVGWQANFNGSARTQDQARLGDWLRVRLALDTVLVVGN